MLWPAVLRRLPILALIYALALQGIAAGWTGAGAHGIAGLQAAIGGLEILCRPSASLGASDDGAAPAGPAHDHDCAQACPSAAAGGPPVQAMPATLRRAAVAAALLPGDSRFVHLTAVAAAFAARAPPHLI
ncbi:MAG: hypothetical protein AB1586_28100 [Pseudomonadota bacterium]|jgi:hypothetical protein